jgi:outer membrane protein OmpA-like peptidoglycan-associated protein
VRKLIVPLLFFVFIAGLSAETFTFKFNKGEKYRFVTTVDEKVYIDDRLSNTVNFLTKVAYTVTEVRDGAGAITALYQVSARKNNDLGSYTTEEEDQSSFTVSPRGEHGIAPRYLYPLTRDIPLFPKGDVKKGDTWSAPGEEIHDLRRPYGIPEPFHIPVNVQYLFLGTKTVNGKSLAQIDISYSFMTKVTGVNVRSAFFPTRISGNSHKLYNWDAAAGRLVSYIEEFDVFYYLSNGSVAEFTGTHTGNVILSQPLNTTETVKDINKAIEKEKLEGVRVEGAEEGVKITLEDIRFQPDSDVITRAEARKIQAIATILKKYPDRDIKLVGHTAAVGTPESCLELSIRRAKSVGDALLKLRARTPDQMTIQGKGLTEPLADNGTEAGRARNRRVEIIILEN